MDAKRPTLRHIIIKMPRVKDKEKMLKAVREKQIISYKGIFMRLSADFMKETLQARRDWQEIFKVMKNRDLQPRLFYPTHRNKHREAAKRWRQRNMVQMKKQIKTLKKDLTKWR